MTNRNLPVSFSHIQMFSTLPSSSILTIKIIEALSCFSFITTVFLPNDMKYTFNLFTNSDFSGLPIRVAWSDQTAQPPSSTDPTVLKSHTSRKEPTAVIIRWRKAKRSEVYRCTKVQWPTAPSISISFRMDYVIKTFILTRQ